MTVFPTICRRIHSCPLRRSFSQATLAFVYFALIPAVTAAQDKTDTAVAPGCGPRDAKLEVKTDRAKHPLGKPDPGKAIVYFLQDDSYFLGVPRPTTRFGIDGNWVGATQRNAYFYTYVDPGEHHLCAGWQSFVGFTSGSDLAAAHFTAEAGGTFFLLPATAMTGNAVQQKCSSRRSIAMRLNFS